MAARRPGEQARRDARARALGFLSDYDRRARGYQAGGERLRGARLEAARGHGGLSDFRRFIRAGDLVLCDVDDALKSWDKKRLVFREVRKVVYTGVRVTKSGRPYKRQRAGERTFRIRNISRRDLRSLIRFEIGKGVDFPPRRYLDQRTILEVSR